MRVSGRACESFREHAMYNEPNEEKIFDIITKHRLYVQCLGERRRYVRRRRGAGPLGRRRREATSPGRQRRWGAAERRCSGRERRGWIPERRGTRREGGRPAHLDHTPSAERKAKDDEKLAHRHDAPALTMSVGLSTLRQMPRVSRGLWATAGSGTRNNGEVEGKERRRGLLAPRFPLNEGRMLIW